MIEYVFAFILGIFAGSITGLLPGIHINLIAAFLISPSFTNSLFSPLALAVFIVAMSIVHLLTDIIPTIFLGVPEEETFLASLPSHQFMKEGRGQEAVVLILLGSLLGLILLFLIAPLYLVFLPAFYKLITSILPFILIFLSAYLILREPSPSKALLIFTCSSFLGLLTFHLPVREPLFPLLTGLFGISALLFSLKSSSFPKQTLSPLRSLLPSKKEVAKSIVPALIAAPFCSFLPGIGSSHAATFGSELVPQNNRSFLMLIGAMNFLVMSLSFVAVYTIQKARSGSAVAVQTLLPDFSFSQLSILFVTIIFATFIGFFLSLWFTKKAALIINKIPYALISKCILAFLIILTFVLSGFTGLLVLVTGSAIGSLCTLLEVRKIQLMASLIIPSVVFYLTH